MGPDAESLRDQILVALKRDIPKLKIVEPSSVSSYVYLQITSIRAGPDSVATSVEVSLIRPAEIIGDEGNKYFRMAIVWKTAAVRCDSLEHLPSLIRDRINEDMTAFAAEYYKQNP